MHYLIITDEIESKAKRCERITAYTFTNKDLLHEALRTYPCYASTRVDTYGPAFLAPTNSRLAVYGDSALEMALCRLWYREEKFDQKYWSALRKGTAGNDNLARVGYDHHLHKCAVLNPGTLAVGHKAMATMLEAIFGAVELDGGPDALLKLLIRLKMVPEILLPEDLFPEDLVPEDLAVEDLALEDLVLDDLVPDDPVAEDPLSDDMRPANEV